MTGPRSEKTRQRTAAPATDRAKLGLTPADLVFGVVLALFVAALASSLKVPPFSLDDQGLLQEFAGRPFASAFGYDHFGHLRPAKNLWFWWLARDRQYVWAFRAATLVSTLLCAIALRRLATDAFTRPIWSVVAAGLWLLNPSTVTVTAWLAASNYSYALLGVLTYLILGLRALASPPGAKTAALCMVASHCALLLAVLHHELASLAPLLLVAHYAGRTNALGIVRRRAWASLAGAASVVVIPLLLRILQTAPAIAYRSSEHSHALLMASSARYLAENLRLWIWPQSAFGVLLTDDPRAHLVANLAWWLMAAVGAWLGWRIARRDRATAFALCWVLVFLLPIINLLPFGNTPVAVHYLCFPGVGLALLVARCIERIADRLPVPIAIGGALAAAGIAAAWQPAFWQTLRAWSDEVPLYETTIKNYPRNIEARANLAEILLRRKRYDDAGSLLDSSLAIAPRNIMLLGNQFELLVATGQPAAALRHLDLHPELVRAAPDMMVQRGLLLLHVGKPQEARTAFELVLTASENPRDRFAAGYQLANLLVREDRLGDARTVLTALMVEFPDNSTLTLMSRLLDKSLRAPH